MDLLKGNLKMSRLKNLLKFFYEYSIEFFPVVERSSTLKGYILRKSALKDINDLEKLNIDLKDFISDNLNQLSIKEFLEKFDYLKNYHQFPIVYTNGDIEIISLDDFKAQYLMEYTIDYKKVLIESRIGIIIFTVEGKIIFKNKFYELIEKQSTEFSSDFFIGEIISNLSEDESNNVDGNINIDFDGVEIEYSLSSKLDKDLDGNAIIITSIIPKSEMVLKEDNLINDNNGEKNKEELIIEYLKNYIIDKVNQQNFSLKDFLEEQERFLFETLTDILDNNIDLISKVLKIDKEKVKSKIKHYNFY